jgi:heptosyltransferase III
MNKPRNILIARTDRIGDVVLTLPAASVLKKHLPDCKITFLLREYTKELASGNPNIDGIIIYDEIDGISGFANILKLVKDREFDTVISVFPRFQLALIFFISGIKTRIGSGYRWYSFLFNKKVFEHRKFGEKHELIHNINLLKTLGVDETVDEKNCVFGLSPSQENKKRIQDYFKNTNIDLTKPIIIFHPGSGGSAVDLPIGKMKELIIRTSVQFDVNIFLTGDKKETVVCEFLSAGNKIYNLCGKFNLGELIALIDRSILLVANSTGPLHIAAALGKDVIGFYPKIKPASATRWGPFTEKKQIFVPSIKCTNCTRKQCEELNCMNSIGTDDIFYAIKNIVNKSIAEN